MSVDIQPITEIQQQPNQLLTPEEARQIASESLARLATSMQFEPDTYAFIPTAMHPNQTNRDHFNALWYERHYGRINEEAIRMLGGLSVDDCNIPYDAYTISGLRYIDEGGKLFQAKQIAYEGITPAETSPNQPAEEYNARVVYHIAQTIVRSYYISHQVVDSQGENGPDFTPMYNLNNTSLINHAFNEYGGAALGSSGCPQDTAA